MDSNERETETEGDLGEGCERASERGGGSGDVRGLERQEERNRQREREKGRERERERERVVKDTCYVSPLAANPTHPHRWHCRH
jgi:hypothetical protein